MAQLVTITWILLVLTNKGMHAVSGEESNETTLITDAEEIS